MPLIGGYFKQRVFLQNFIFDLLWPTFSKKFLVSLNFSLKFSLFTNIPYCCFTFCFDNLLKTLNYDHYFLEVVSTIDCFVKPLLFNVIILFQQIQQFSFYGFVCFFFFCSSAPLEPMKNIGYKILLINIFLWGFRYVKHKKLFPAELFIFPAWVENAGFHFWKYKKSFLLRKYKKFFQSGFF